MGADLYIERITEAAKLKYDSKFNEAARQRDEFTVLARAEMQFGRKDRAEFFENQAAAMQQEVDKYYSLLFPSQGYFRDSYNGTSVAWRLGLSWWKDAPGGDVTKAQLDQLRKFRDAVKSRKLKPLTMAELKDMGCKVDDGENSLVSWQRYFRNKKRRLVNFLDRAIKEVEQGGKVCFSC